MSVAMALAEVNHHSAPRRPKTARARGVDAARADRRCACAGCVGATPLAATEGGPCDSGTVAGAAGDLHRWQDAPFPDLEDLHGQEGSGSTGEVGAGGGGVDGAAALFCGHADG